MDVNISIAGPRTSLKLYSLESLDHLLSSYTPNRGWPELRFRRYLPLNGKSINQNIEKTRFLQVLMNFATFLIWMDLIMMSEQAPVIISKYQWKGASKNDVIYDKHTYRVFHEFFWQKLWERVLLCNKSFILQILNTPFL